MERPPSLTALSPTPYPAKDNNKKKRPPSPEEVLAHYESQGLDPREASLKAIADLQSMLFRTISSVRGDKKGRFTADTGRKLDTLNTRLAILEMKLDSKPGFPESLAIGVAAGALLNAAGAALPHLARIWDSVKTATRSSPPSSSSS